MKSVAIIDNSVAIENRRTMRQVKTKLSRQGIFLLCDRHSSVCKDQGKFNATTEEYYVATQHSELGMGKKKILSRQTQHKTEVNFVATKTNIVAIGVEKITKRML